MRQYELAIRIAQVHHLVDERKYKKALAVIQTLDMRQVRSLSDLKVFAEVYTRTEQYEAAKATYLRIYRRSKTRRVLYRLIYLSIRTNALEDAEAYYQEFIRMNPNARDALILRYRIDKASGAPIGRLIEILQELKQEEYIEEWAYELAKLYHRAGRREECMEECHDIILWFGSGEIVERAKILIDHLEEKDPIPYYDDKDFTVPKKEEPNPDDTGSLPDLNEFIKERKAQKREERRAERAARKAEYEDDDDEDYGEDVFDDEIEEEELIEAAKEQERASNISEKKKEEQKSDKEQKTEDDFIDDYEEDDFEQDGMDLSQKAKDGIQKLSGFLKFGKKEEDKSSEKEAAESQKEALPERKMIAEKRKATEKKVPEYVPHSQSGTGITQDLAREISAIYEMEHREQLKEKAVTVINEVPNIATNVVDRMTQAIQKSAGRSYIPLDIEEIQGEAAKKEETAQQPDKEKEELREDKPQINAPVQNVEEEPIAPEDELTEKAEEEPVVQQEDAPAEKAEEELAVQEETTAENVEEETAVQEDTLAENVEEETAVQEEVPAENVEEELAVQQEPGEEIQNDVIQDNAEEKDALTIALEKEVEEYQEAKAKEEALQLEGQNETELLKNLLEEEIHDPEEEAAKDVSQETEQTDTVASAMENYAAPEIPVVETDYMEMPEITYEDLPTTRALQQSFQNVLKLIAGELDPSHFVLMGEGTDRIVGVSKQIVRVMKETGYLSQGRIAKIHASQLNKMDLISFRDQLKGNCLLIEEASDLLFPTITKIFSIMEEYYGDFVVILADEGTTLDQLFRFVPVLARKFKYIIDISKYTKKDYE